MIKLLPAFSRYFPALFRAHGKPYSVVLVDYLLPTYYLFIYVPTAGPEARARVQCIKVQKSETKEYRKVLKRSEALLPLLSANMYLFSSLLIEIRRRQVRSHTKPSRMPRFATLRELEAFNLDNISN